MLFLIRTRGPWLLQSHGHRTVGSRMGGRACPSREDGLGLGQTKPWPCQAGCKLTAKSSSSDTAAARAQWPWRRALEEWARVEELWSEARKSSKREGELSASTSWHQVRRGRVQGGGRVVAVHGRHAPATCPPVEAFPRARGVRRSGRRGRRFRAFFKPNWTLGQKQSLLYS